MPEGEEISTNICDLPTEVLLHIFTYLPGRQLARSRQVCVRWKSIIDRLAWSDILWRRNCKYDFPNVYKEARIQSKPGLLWFHTYRSLSLWPQLKHAREVRDEFAPAQVYDDEIINLKVLQDGIIAVHKRGSIQYYDIETLELSKRGTITGDYLHWTENGDIMVIVDYHMHLYILRKILYNPSFETNITVDDVKLYLLNNREVYYVTLENDIFLVQLDNASLSTKLIKRSPESVMCLGYSDKLNILTFEGKIYTVEGSNLVLAHDLEGGSDLLHQLYRFNLIRTADWRIVYQWHFLWCLQIPQGPLRNILMVKLYGDMVFVGCKWGVLRIYYKPFVDDKFDFYNSEPLMQFNFMERRDCPVLSTRCSVIQVDVMESEEGHTVVVAMPKKVAVLNFEHNFKRTASVAMLPYTRGQHGKFMKIQGDDDDCLV